MHLQGLNASTARGRWGKWYMTAITKVAEDNCSGLREALRAILIDFVKGLEFPTGLSFEEGVSIPTKNVFRHFSSESIP